MKYVDRDGYVHWLVCHCGLEADWTEWDDGARTLHCANGHRLGIQIDGGTLDLGLVQPDPDRDNDFVIYGND